MRNTSLYKLQKQGLAGKNIGFYRRGQYFQKQQENSREKIQNFVNGNAFKNRKKLQRQELTGQNIGFCCQGQCFQKQQKQGLTGKNIGFYCQGQYLKTEKDNKIKDSQEKIQE